MEWRTYQIPKWAARFIPTRTPTRNRAETIRQTDRHRAFASAANNNMTFSWDSDPQTADQTLLKDLDSLRTRSREQVRNNDYAKRFVKLVADNVVGSKGIRLQSQAVGRSGGRDQMSISSVERHWRMWGKLGNCEVTGTMSWIDIQRLVTTSWMTDGEALVLKVNRGRYGMQLQMIDPVLLDEQYNDTLANGHEIRLGIEFDDMGAPVAYHIGQRPTGARTGYDYQRNTTRIPADRIIHVFSPELVSQSRGIPAMATALLRMNMLDGYQEAALVNARLGASNVNYITSPDGGATMPNDGVDTDGSLIQYVEPGSQRLLPPGYGVTAYDPTYPSNEFADFVKGILRGISVGLGVDYSALSGDLEGVNYSSIRAGVLETRETWKGMQQFIIDHVCQPVFEWWLHEALMTQALTSPAGTNPLPLFDEDKLQNVKWQPRRWAWVDPLKDMQANKVALELGLTSRTKIMSETGEDADEIWTQNDADNKDYILPDGLEPAAGNMQPAAADSGNKGQTQ